MAAPWMLLLALWTWVAVVAAAPSGMARTLNQSPYAPVAAACPSTPLVRQANARAAAESAWLARRKPLADAALAAWIRKVNAGFGTSSMPTVGLTTSGGGYRSFLTGAGVVKGLDGRDSNTSTSGLFQGLTYHGGLSGGSWLVSALAGNGWQTVSTLESALWGPALNEGLFTAGFSITNPTYAKILNDLLAKKEAGYTLVIDDVWGRLLSDTLLEGDDGGVVDTYSGIARSAPFTSHSVPFPIITSIGVDTAAGQCIPPLNATQYEFTPYEFGSWDRGVDAFAPTQYLGSDISAGRPAKQGSTACTTGFDNLGYVFGTSSNLFNEEICAGATISSLPPAIAGLLELAGAAVSSVAAYADYPNPFYHSPVPGTDPDVAAAQELTLADGGETGQNDPLWPFLQPERCVDVLIVNDNSADTSANFPNGTEIHQTYLRAQQVGLTKMPAIPDPSYFVAVGPRPIFFGCHNAHQVTLVYLPNTNFTFPSGESTFKLQYSTAESAGMIANGVAVADQNGNAQWSTCLACAIMQKTGGKLPAACTACLKEYCYN